MNEEKRINGGYEIIENCHIGRTELVIGHNSKAPNPYVCWYCKDGSDYFWGYYCNQLSEARDKMNERYQTGSIIFCDVCIRKILERAEREKTKKGVTRWRMKKNVCLAIMTVKQSIHIGKKEVMLV